MLDFATTWLVRVDPCESWQRLCMYRPWFIESRHRKAWERPGGALLLSFPAQPNLAYPNSTFCIVRAQNIAEISTGLWLLAFPSQEGPAGDHWSLLSQYTLVQSSINALPRKGGSQVRESGLTCWDLLSQTPLEAGSMAPQSQ